MKKALLLLFFAATPVLASEFQPNCPTDSDTVRFVETCYYVSLQQDLWSKTPQMLCRVTDNQSQNYTFTLKTGMPRSQETLATFNYKLLQRARCIDCNEDVFGVEDGPFSALSIKFHGKRDWQAAKEEGTVSIGSTVFYYHR